MVKRFCFFVVNILLEKSPNLKNIHEAPNSNQTQDNNGSDSEPGIKQCEILFYKNDRETNQL